MVLRMMEVQRVRWVDDLPMHSLLFILVGALRDTHIQLQLQRPDPSSPGYNQQCSLADRHFPSGFWSAAACRDLGHCLTSLQVRLVRSAVAGYICDDNCCS